MEKQTVNGKQESETLLRLNQFEGELDDFNKSIGLVKVNIDPVMEQALNFSIDELNGMDVADIANYAYKLQSYSLYIQRQYNRVKNLYRWANHNLTIITAKEGNQYGNQYTKYEEKKAFVAAGNSYGVQLNKVILDAGARMEELDSLSTRIASVSKALSDIQQCRRFNNG